MTKKHHVSEDRGSELELQRRGYDEGRRWYRLTALDGRDADNMPIQIVVHTWGLLIDALGAAERMVKGGSPVLVELLAMGRDESDFTRALPDGSFTGITMRPLRYVAPETLQQMALF